MSTLKSTFQLAIDLIEEDLRRYQQAQESDTQAFGVGEARSIQQYLTALSGAYRASGGEDPGNSDPTLHKLTDEEIMSGILAQKKEQEDA